MMEKETAPEPAEVSPEEAEAAAVQEAEAL